MSHRPSTEARPSLLGFAFWLLKSVAEKAILVGVCLVLSVAVAVASWWLSYQITSNEARAILVAFCVGIVVFAIAWFAVLYLTYRYEKSGQPDRPKQSNTEN